MEYSCEVPKGRNTWKEPTKFKDFRGVRTEKTTTAAHRFILAVEEMEKGQKDLALRLAEVREEVKQEAGEEAIKENAILKHELTMHSNPVNITPPPPNFPTFPSISCLFSAIWLLFF